MAKTVVALYDQISEAQDAIRDLEDNGFSREDISLVATDSAREQASDMDTGGGGDAVNTGALGGAGVGAALGGAAGLMVGLGALAIPGIGPILAGGPLVTTLAGAGMGAVAGGLVGALIGLGIPEEDANAYTEGVRRGGTLLTVHTPDDRADLAANVLNRYSPVNVQQRTSGWRQAGWTRFDADAGPFRRYDREADREHSLDTGTTGAADLDREQNRYGEHLAERDLTTGERDTEDGRTTYDTASGFDLYEIDFRRHFDRTFATTGYGYDRYRPAYVYGYDLHRSSDCNGDCRWEDVESNARRDWEQTHPSNAWEEFKEAVREGWMALAGH